MVNKVGFLGHKGTYPLKNLSPAMSNTNPYYQSFFFQGTYTGLTNLFVKKMLIKINHVINMLMC